MESLNNVIQYPLNTIQLRGIKSIVKKNLTKSTDEVIDLLKEYTNTINFVSDIREFEIMGRPHILIKTFDTAYFIKKFKQQKEKPLILS